MHDNSATMVAVIPARGGSKRVKRKNLMRVNGKPLLAYAIEAALDSRLFSRVWVNSDDEEILAVGEQYGAAAYCRPEPLAGDNTFIIEVIREMIAFLDMSDESIMGIALPTCPLRLAEDIVAAYRLFLDRGGQLPVVSVSAYETPIQLAQFIGEDGRLEAVFPCDYRKSTRSTDHRQAYRYNEGIIFNRVSNLKVQNTLIGERPFPYVMPPERSVAIDYPYQMELVRVLLAQRQK